MGAFNELTAETSCPVCQKKAAFTVQFKYGDTWQHSYSLGEQLKWGGNNVGTPGVRKALVEAIGGPCPHCGRNDLEFDVLIESDKIVQLKPIGIDRPNPSAEGFVILE